MKKYIFIFVLFIIVIPSIVLASWWNPFTWFNKKVNDINNIEQKIQNNTPVVESKLKENKVSSFKNNKSIYPEDSINKIKITETNNPSQVSEIKPVQKNNSDLIPAHVLSFNSNNTSYIGFNNFKKIISSNFSKNYGAYLNKQIQITSLVINDFLPADNGGGYIHTFGNSNSSSNQDEIMLYINNSDDYQEVLNILNDSDSINVFGIGMSSKKIEQVNSYRTASLNYPIMSVERIDRCQSSCSTIFSKTIPQDQGKKAGSYDKISLKDALDDAVFYTSNNFTTQVLVRDFVPYDNKGNYSVGIVDQNSQDILASVVVDSNSKNQLKSGNLIEVSGHLRYVGSQHLNIDTDGGIIKIIK